MNNLMNIGVSVLPHYDEIMDRQREEKEMKAEKRSELIAQKQKDYLGDVGTFFEFIQGIEIGENDAEIFKLLHIDLISPFPNAFTGGMRRLFKQYCEEKAEREVDNDSN